MVPVDATSDDHPATCRSSVRIRLALSANVQPLRVDAPAARRSRPRRRRRSRRARPCPPGTERKATCLVQLGPSRPSTALRTVEANTHAVWWQPCVAQTPAFCPGTLAEYRRDLICHIKVGVYTSRHRASAWTASPHPTHQRRAHGRRITVCGTEVSEEL